MHNKITFRDLGQQGRLGNQLFQIAATISTAIDKELVPVFPPWEYNKYLKTPLPTEQVIPTDTLLEEGFHFSPINLGNCIEGPIKVPVSEKIFNLSGYFQSEKYFRKHREIILQMFEMEPNRLDSLLEQNFHKTGYKFYANELYKSFCAIHVRRGDYVDNPHYAQLGMDYYKEAIRTLVNLPTNDAPIVFFVFSDDIAWCKENFPSHFVFMEGNTDFEDLTLMSLCNYFITANSSFSWWGAYLSKSKHKHVIFPSQWFGEAKQYKDTKDLYFEGSRSFIP